MYVFKLVLSFPSDIYEGVELLTHRMRSTGEGNGKPLQYSCLQNPMNSMKRQKDMTLEDELPRLICAQYAIGEE